MPPNKCGKVKNPCKICFESVTEKTGLQCLGACKKWVHFKCLNYTPGKIQDIKNGYIQVKCPCPNCETHSSKKSTPYYCGKSRCPASAKLTCEAPLCPKDKHIVPSTLCTHCHPENCDSFTDEQNVSSVCQKKEEIYGHKKPTPRCPSPSQDKPHERRPHPVREKKTEHKHTNSPDCVQLTRVISSDCKRVEQEKATESARNEVRKKTAENNYSPLMGSAPDHCNSLLDAISPELRPPTVQERSPERKRPKEQERSKNINAGRKKLQEHKACAVRTASPLRYSALEVADDYRTESLEKITYYDHTQIKKKVLDAKSCKRPNIPLQDKSPERQRSSLDESLEIRNTSRKKSKGLKRYLEGIHVIRTPPTQENNDTQEYSPTQLSSSKECLSLTRSTSSESKEVQSSNSNLEIKYNKKRKNCKRPASSDGKENLKTKLPTSTPVSKQTKRNKDKLSQRTSPKKYKDRHKSANTQSSLTFYGSPVSSDSLATKTQAGKSYKDSPDHRSTASIRKMLNSKDIQFPSVVKAPVVSDVEFSQNMPSHVIGGCEKLNKKNCSVEALETVRFPKFMKNLYNKSRHSFNGTSSEVNAIKACHSDSCLIPSDSRNTIFNAMEQMYGAMGHFHNQFRELMEKMIHVFKSC